MSTQNSEIMSSTWQFLKGKWPILIVTYLVFMVLSQTLGFIPKIGSVFTMILAGPFALGSAIFSLHVSRGEEYRTEQIFDGFKNFGNALVAYLLMILFIFLWMLALIIPGFIAAMSYSMTFYIMADNPTIEPMEALRKSKAMMDGYKMKLFTLQLRFILLTLLSIFTLGIGLLWLIPYMHITAARFYDDIKSSDLDATISTDTLQV
jgi:uncharacterized membrane protein